MKINFQVSIHHEKKRELVLTHLGQMKIDLLRKFIKKMNFEKIVQI